MKWLASIETPAYAALRIVAGASFAMHGVQKVLGWMTTKPQPAVGSQLWFGGLIELLGGTLIALGVWTRCSAFIASGTMAVAYVQFHWKLAFEHGNWLPIVNKGELALIYCFLFLFIAARGSGSASLGKRLHVDGRG